MENVAEALKIAGFTILFVTALSIAMITIMQGKRTSETIINYSDKTKYYSDIQIENDNSTSRDRIVELKDIIPTLYRYDQEQYIVLFYDGDENTPLKIFEGNRNSKKRFELGIDDTEITYLNYNLEAKLEEDWTRDHDTIKTHVGDVVKYLFQKNLDEYNFIEKIDKSDMYENNLNIDKEKLYNEPNDNNEQIRVIKYIKNERI